MKKKNQLPGKIFQKKDIVFSKLISPCPGNIQLNSNTHHPDLSYTWGTSVAYKKTKYIWNVLISVKLDNSHAKYVLPLKCITSNIWGMAEVLMNMPRYTQDTSCHTAHTFLQSNWKFGWKESLPRIEASKLVFLRCS